MYVGGESSAECVYVGGESSTECVYVGGESSAECGQSWGWLLQKNNCISCPLLLSRISLLHSRKKLYSYIYFCNTIPSTARLDYYK